HRLSAQGRPPKSWTSQLTPRHHRLKPQHAPKSRASGHARQGGVEGREDARHLLASDAAEVGDLAAFAARGGKGVHRRSHGGRTRLRATGSEGGGTPAAKHTSR